jgi:hypothetical protein
MAVPNAPLEGDGDKILFSVDDNSGTNRANLLRGFQHGTLNGEPVADLGVYTTSGLLKNFGHTLGGSTAEQIIATSTPCQGVLIRAGTANAATLYVGTSAVVASEGATNSGWPLAAGETVGVPCRDANTVYIRGTSGDKVTCLASID